MPNPHPALITDEASGILVKNQRYVDWEAGATAERERIMELAKEAYPSIVTWPIWQSVTGELS